MSDTILTVGVTYTFSYSHTQSAVYDFTVLAYLHSTIYLIKIIKSHNCVIDHLVGRTFNNFNSQVGFCFAVDDTKDIYSELHEILTS